jgi:ribosomal protein L40E
VNTEEKRAYNAQYVKDRIAAGFCIYCGGPNDNGKLRCVQCSEKTAGVYKLKRGEAKANGQCIACFKGPAAPGKSRCETCIEYRKEWLTRTRSKRKEEGRCAECDAPNPDGGATCRHCRDKGLVADAARTADCEEEGKCFKCSAKTEPGNKTCRRCLDMQNGWRKKQNLKHAAEGKCYCCNEPHLPGLVRCLRHWFGSVAIGRTKNRKTEESLRQLWERQGGRCAVTGVKLTPGVNASLDHVTPTARGGSNEESNLAWASWTINRIKSDFTLDEFVNLCRWIAAKADGAKDDDCPALVKQLLERPSLSVKGRRQRK